MAALFAAMIGALVGGALTFGGTVWERRYEQSQTRKKEFLRASRVHADRTALVMQRLEESKPDRSRLEHAVSDLGQARTALYLDEIAGEIVDYEFETREDPTGFRSAMQAVWQTADGLLAIDDLEARREERSSALMAAQRSFTQAARNVVRGAT